MVFKKKKKPSDELELEEEDMDLDIEEELERDEDERDRERESRRTNRVNRGKKETWVVRRIPKEYETAVVNLQTEDVLDEKAALAKILEELKEIKKALVE